MAQQQTELTKPSPLLVQFRADLVAMESQFALALPPHIPSARFCRIINTAVGNNEKLQRCTRQSLWSAFMKCAQDGLLPDGREAAIVPYGDNEDGRASSDVAAYLPMVGGIRKKVRNAGVLRDWSVQIVKEGDVFQYQLGDDPRIHHVPAPRGGSERKVIAAYSIATYPDRTKSFEIMNIDEIEDIRKKSKAKRGPWSDPVFYGEMCKKTVAKRHAKQLPMSTDLDRVMHRDDELYDFKGAREEAKKIERPGSAAAMLDWFAGGGGGDDDKSASQQTIESKVQEVPKEAAKEAPKEKIVTTTTPRTVDEYFAYARAIMIATPTADELRAWFANEPQRKLRNACGITKETFDKLAAEIEARCRELEP